MTRAKPASLTLGFGFALFLWFSFHLLRRSPT